MKLQTTLHALLKKVEQIVGKGTPELTKVSMEYLAFNSHFEVLWPGNYMMLTEPEKMSAVFPEIDNMRASCPSSAPTAFCMRVKDQDKC
jgi:hypothetical protein